MSHVKLLYFVAAVPPAPLRNELHEMKKHFSQNYQTLKSLNSPPHITLIPPFLLLDKDENMLISDIEKVAHEIAPFMVDIDGYGAFGQKVIFLRITENAPLNKLRIMLFDALHAYHLKQHIDVRFTPHITLAFRDISLQMFQQAWGKYASANYRRSFLLDQVALLKHNGQQWDVLASLPFQAEAQF